MHKMSAKNDSAFFLLTLELCEQSYGQYKQAAHWHAWNESESLMSSAFSGSQRVQLRDKSSN